MWKRRRSQNDGSREDVGSSGRGSEVVEALKITGNGCGA
jgi:hypothetical protein